MKLNELSKIINLDTKVKLLFGVQRKNIENINTIRAKDFATLVANDHLGYMDSVVKYIYAEGDVLIIRTTIKA